MGDARFAGDIKDFTRSEAVESSRSADGIGSHVFEVKPIADFQDNGELIRWGDTIEAIASRTPDRAFEGLSVSGTLCSVVVEAAVVR